MLLRGSGGGGGKMTRIVPGRGVGYPGGGGGLCREISTASFTPSMMMVSCEEETILDGHGGEPPREVYRIRLPVNQ